MGIELKKWREGGGCLDVFVEIIFGFNLVFRHVLILSSYFDLMFSFLIIEKFKNATWTHCVSIFLVNCTHCVFWPY